MVILFNYFDERYGIIIVKPERQEDQVQAEKSQLD
jgi:hypothetical protein